MNISRRIRLAGLLVAGIAVSLVAGSSGAAQARPRQIVLHPRFHVVARDVLASGAASVFTTSRYLLAWNGTPPRDYPSAGSGVVIDDHASGSRSIVFPSSSCYPLTIGGPWAGFSCLGGFELYNLASRQWRPLIEAASLAAVCSPSGECGLQAAAIGSQWVQWEWGEGCEHCQASYAFQNLDTGQADLLPAWRAGSRTVPDLSSPSLAHRLCRPLRVPFYGGAAANTRDTGTLWSYGSSALIQSANAYGEPILTYVQRCGSSRRRYLPTNGELPAINATSVVWSPLNNTVHHRGVLDGLFVGDDQRFELIIPAKIARIGFMRQAYLTTKHLYLLDYQGDLWRAPAPVQP